MQKHKSLEGNKYNRKGSVSSRPSILRVLFCYCFDFLKASRFLSMLLFILTNYMDKFCRLTPLNIEILSWKINSSCLIKLDHVVFICKCYRCAKNSNRWDTCLLFHLCCSRRYNLRVYDQNIINFSKIS